MDKKTLAKLKKSQGKVQKKLKSVRWRKNKKEHKYRGFSKIKEIFWKNKRRFPTTFRGKSGKERRKKGYKKNKRCGKQWLVRKNKKF